MVNFATTCRLCPFTVMVGSLYSFPDAGWYTSSDFFLLIDYSFHRLVKLDLYPLAFSPLYWHSLSCHLHRKAYLAQLSEDAFL